MSLKRIEIIIEDRRETVCGYLYGNGKIKWHCIDYNNNDVNNIGEPIDEKFGNDIEKIISHVLNTGEKPLKNCRALPGMTAIEQGVNDDR